MTDGTSTRNVTGPTRIRHPPKGIRATGRSWGPANHPCDQPKLKRLGRCSRPLTPALSRDCGG
jgi:hypothetical protein